ncbi:hypothetical protein EVAR_50480_1 [Eumeta japonica]|uniref:Uncharacterized protein n=1 Tax=Eumeta variegata TaxID=151549 RepID=A0A4C1XWY4_EUMVA|nr:hypothetical protein EVAR_50480_1 [Eumeta japonica]
MQGVWHCDRLQQSSVSGKTTFLDRASERGLDNKRVEEAGRGSLFGINENRIVGNSVLSYKWPEAGAGAPRQRRLPRLGRAHKEIDASQAEHLGWSCLSIVPRSRSHARLRRNVTMSHAFSGVQPAFVDL